MSTPVPPPGPNVPRQPGPNVPPPQGAPVGRARTKVFIAAGVAVGILAIIITVVATRTPLEDNEFYQVGYTTGEAVANMAGDQQDLERQCGADTIYLAMKYGMSDDDSEAHRKGCRDGWEETR